MLVTNQSKELIQELFIQECASLNYFFKHLDLDASEKILEMFLACQGIIFFTGVGKSGLVAKKIAVSMTSTGTRALYISPTDSLHGDIGLVSSNDIFVLISKSGETDELLNLIPYVRNKGAQIVAIVSEKSNRLSRACDASITLPIDKELCPFDLAPTTSTSIQMIFGDVMAIALMRLKNFTIDQYADNHPKGKIGKRITMRVKDIMRTGPMLPICFPEDHLQDVLPEQSEKQAGCIFIVDKDRVLKGIFTDGDLRRAIQKHGSKALGQPIEKVMTQNPRFISPEMFAWDAMKLMEADQKRPITVLPVVDDAHRILGLLKHHDILQSIV